MNKSIRKARDAGITLIALVVTIIILLILAAVTISIALGNNGLISRSKDGKGATERAQIIENAKIDILDKIAENNGDFSEEDLIEILTSSAYQTKGTLSDNGEESVLQKTLTSNDGKFNILVSEIYDGDFTVGRLDLDTLRTKILIETGDCMIDENGNIIPINVWRYEITGENTCKVEGNYNAYYASECAYSGGILENGTLEYNLPVYIKVENKVYTVNELGWFLLDSPYIWDSGPDDPSGEVDLSNLTELIIPISIEKIDRYALFYCNHIINLTIPSNVIYLEYGVFRGWTNSQTINVPFKEGNKPNGWDLYWNDECSAQINYLKD